MKTSTNGGERGAEGQKEPCAIRTERDCLPADGGGHKAIHQSHSCVKSRRQNTKKRKELAQCVRRHSSEEKGRQTAGGDVVGRGEGGKERTKGGRERVDGRGADSEGVGRSNNLSAAKVEADLRRGG